MRHFLTAIVLLVGCGVDDPLGLDRADTGHIADIGIGLPDQNPAVGDAAAPDVSMAAPDLMAVPDMGMVVPCTTGTRNGDCRHVDDCAGARESVPGFCPGPAEIQCCVDVAAGTCVENPAVDDMPRPNIGLVEAAGVGGCPDGMLPVDTFCIDQYEAALVELLANGSERSWSPFFNPGVSRVYAVSLANAVPQGYITGDQASAACAEAGKRLCTDTEWLRACQGSSDSTFPYGDTRQPSVCNDARSVHPAVDYFNSTDQSVFSMLDNACINQQDDSLARTGAHPACVTEDGALDMMGNLHEWTADPTGTFRGGFYADTEINGPGCLYRTTAHNTGHWDYSTGFRCCADGL